MTKTTKQDLEKQVMMAAREYGISSVLYRHAVGAKLGVNATDMECLAILFFKGVSTPTELAEYTGLSSGATTAMLDRLQSGGLIERWPNPRDRRGTLIVVNTSATKHIGPLFNAIRNAQDTLVASYSSADLRRIVTFLQQLTGIWETEREKLQPTYIGS